MIFFSLSHLPVDVSEDSLEKMEFYVKAEADLDFEGNSNPSAIRGATCFRALIL